MQTVENIREQLNLTQLEFSQQLGISKRLYNYKISGETEWKISELIKLTELCKDDIAIKHGGDTYSINIKKL